MAGSARSGRARVSGRGAGSGSEVAQLAKPARDDGTLAVMVLVARTDGNLIALMLDAARAGATLGEICGALKAEWGEYRKPARFSACLLTKVCIVRLPTS